MWGSYEQIEKVALVLGLFPYGSHSAKASLSPSIRTAGLMCNFLLPDKFSTF